MNYKAPIRNNKLLEEAYEAGRASVLNEQKYPGFENPPYHPVYNPSGTWSDTSGNWPWGDLPRTPGDPGYRKPGLRPGVPGNKHPNYPGWNDLPTGMPRQEAQ
jgi:hypothetical protein